MTNQNLLDGALPQVVESCKAAGWRSGIVRKRSWGRKRKCRSDEIPCSAAILDEFYGLRVEPPTDSKDGMEIVFGPSMVESLADGMVTSLSVILNTRLSPIGYAGGSTGVLLISEFGHVLLVSIACFGIYVTGDTFPDAMNRILTGMHWLPLFVDRRLDTDGDFEHDGASRQDKDAIVLPAGQGLQEFEYSDLW